MRILVSTIRRLCRLLPGRRGPLPLLPWVPLLALAAVWSLAGTAGAVPGEVYGLSLRDAACAQGADLLLGEVAQPYGPFPQELWDTLGRAPLLQAPDKVGRMVTVPKATLREHLLVALVRAMGPTAGPDLLSRCTLPSGLALRRGGAVLTREMLERQVLSAMCPLLGALPGRTEMHDLNLPDVVFLDDLPASLSVEPSGPLAAGRVGLRVSLKAGDGKVVRQLTVSGFLDQWLAVPTAARPINPGPAVTPDLITFREKNLAYLPAQAWDGKGGPWRVKRPVGEGQPLTMDNMETVPAVPKGRTVTLIFEGPHVSLSAPAEALADAGLGQVVNVRNTITGKTVQAVVTGENTVRVH